MMVSSPTALATRTTRQEAWLSPGLCERGIDGRQLGYIEEVHMSIRWECDRDTVDKKKKKMEAAWKPRGKKDFFFFSLQR